MKSEYKSLNALMNPHFIFNTLNNVQGLVNRDDKLAANEYIRVFADLIRQNMHNISKELIPLQHEINLVANYLSLEKLRFKEHLNYTIDIEGDLDLSEILVPPLLVQPLVENSIKHGIYPLESGDGQIRIHIFEHNDVLVIEVMDNGIGLQAAKEGRQPSHESFGLENIRKRISQLSVILNKQILFDIREKKRGEVSWTVVTISIPITPNP
jgi:sensor histidine kinase YesM